MLCFLCLARLVLLASPLVAKEVLPVLFTALVGLVVLLPFATLAVDALREVREIADYGRTVERSGIPVPDFVIQLPYVGPWVADRWRELYRTQVGPRRLFSN